MRFRVVRERRIARSASLLLLVWAAGALLTAQAPARTVWDGVYTDAQAERATATFNQSCARCHTLTADGTRPLSGDKFWEGYTQRTVADLLTYVRTNMPNGSGGSLPAASYNDLVALILKSNGLPAGNTEITPETVADVQIIPKGGAGELPANTLVRVVGCLAPRSGGDWVLTNGTAPVRIDKTGPVPEDATRPLGDRTMALKFVLTRLDSFVGQRMSVSGILIGAGGAEGINVTTVNRVAATCP
ncbi:MAG TPA: cytochrome c [Vicinamibacterales bacterium]|nr:cytochrome c [Vicinamibacterales bacterium]